MRPRHIRHLHPGGHWRDEQDRRLTTLHLPAGGAVARRSTTRRSVARRSVAHRSVARRSATPTRRGATLIDEVFEPAALGADRHDRRPKLIGGKKLAEDVQSTERYIDMYT